MEELYLIDPLLALSRPPILGESRSEVVNHLGKRNDEFMATSQAPLHRSMCSNSLLPQNTRGQLGKGKTKCFTYQPGDFDTAEVYQLPSSFVFVVERNFFFTKTFFNYRSETGHFSCFLNQYR